MQNLDRLRRLCDVLPDRLRALEPIEAGRKTSPTAWSHKQELGHLLDSAANNHQRMVRAQLEDAPAMPSYDGEQWVTLHRYQERDWTSLVNSWTILNRQLLAAAEAASDTAAARVLTIGDSAPLTLQFVFDDYLDHMLGHLHHMGIVADDLAPAPSH
jgi:hypothetical protein